MVSLVTQKLDISLSATSSQKLVLDLPGSIQDCENLHGEVSDTRTGHLIKSAASSQQLGGRSVWVIHSQQS